MARESRNDRRIKRHWRVRSQLSGTAERPRLSVFRSNTFIYAQVIDDTTGQTLAAASSNQKELKGSLAGKTKTLDAAKLVGQTVAQRAQEKGVKRVCFDRSGYKYHGRVKALADAAREAGLEF